MSSGMMHFPGQRPLGLIFLCRMPITKTNTEYQVVYEHQQLNLESKNITHCILIRLKCYQGNRRKKPAEWWIQRCALKTKNSTSQHKHTSIEVFFVYLNKDLLQVSLLLLCRLEETKSTLESNAKKLDVVEMGISKSGLQREVLAYIFSIRMPKRLFSGLKNQACQSHVLLGHILLLPRKLEVLLPTLSSHDDSLKQGIFSLFLPVLTYLVKSERISQKLELQIQKSWIPWRLNEYSKKGFRASSYIIKK